MNEFQNCPFCGKQTGIPDTLNFARGRPSKFRVRCVTCGASSGWRETEGEAWDAWNMRVLEKQPPINAVINGDTFVFNNLLYSRNALTRHCAAQKEFRGKLFRIKEDVFNEAYEECLKAEGGNGGCTG